MSSQNKFTTNSLWRSNFSEKQFVRYYPSGGESRDGYILNKSGGVNGSSGSFVYSKQNADKPGYLDRKTKYYSDGKGRDTYILKNSGGLFYDSGASDQKQQFYSTLRSYQSMRKSPMITFISNKNQETFKKQSYQSQMLSQPKQFNTDIFHIQREQIFNNQDSPSQRIQFNQRMLSEQSPQSWSSYRQKSLTQNSQQNDFTEQSSFSPMSNIKKLPQISHIRQHTHA